MKGRHAARDETVTHGSRITTPPVIATQSAQNARAVAVPRRLSRTVSLLIMPPPALHGRIFRPTLVAAVCYFVLTALRFRNLLPVITANLFADPLLNASILASNANHVPLTSNIGFITARHNRGAVTRALAVGQ